MAHNSEDAPPPRHEVVYRRLAESILHGELLPGEPVTLQALADRFGVSLTPAREAVRRLTAEGALRALGNRRVAIPEPDRAELTEIAVARRAIEPALAAMATPRADEGLLRRLEELDAAVNRAMDRGDVHGYMRANAGFHFALYAHAGARVLLPIARGLWLRLAPLYRLVAGCQGTARLIDHHQALLDALTARDPDAAARAVLADIEQGLALICDAQGWRRV